MRDRRQGSGLTDRHYARLLRALTVIGTMIAAALWASPALAKQNQRAAKPHGPAVVMLKVPTGQPFALTPRVPRLGITEAGAAATSGFSRQIGKFILDMTPDTILTGDNPMTRADVVFALHRKF